MRVARSAVSSDYDVALHMNVSGHRQPVKSQSVGVLEHASPLLAIALPLRAVGRGELPASVFRAHDGLHLHPALVAAGTHATCELAAAKLGVTAPDRDEWLFRTLAHSTPDLGEPLARWTEMALHRLQWLVPHVEQLAGGTRLHGLVRWATNPRVADSQAVSGDQIIQPLLHHLLLAFSSPPINTLRRAPSLEYYRAEGVMLVRSFGQFMPDPEDET